MISFNVLHYLMKSSNFSLFLLDLIFKAIISEYINFLKGIKSAENCFHLTWIYLVGAL